MNEPIVRAFTVSEHNRRHALVAAASPPMPASFVAKLRKAIAILQSVATDSDASDGGAVDLTPIKDAVASIQQVIEKATTEPDDDSDAPPSTGQQVASLEAKMRKNATARAMHLPPAEGNALRDRMMAAAGQYRTRPTVRREGRSLIFGVGS